MKNHLIIWLKEGKTMDMLPYWEDLIHDKNVDIPHFTPEIDKLFGEFNLPVFYTSEYEPKEENWSKEEMEADLNKIYRFILKENKNFPEELVKKINMLPYVTKVEKAEIGISNLPRVSESLSFGNYKPGKQIYLSDAHLFSQGHPDIKIAVLDTGVDVNHYEFKENILPGKDFVDIINGTTDFIGDYLDIDNDPEDDVGHGTHICGIISSQGKKMDIGVAPKCKIIPVRVLGALKKGDNVVGAGLIDQINNGIKWSVDQGADVINMSLGIRHSGGGLPHEQVIRYALKKGVTVVAASGNDGTQEMYFPGALKGVIAVGAVDKAGAMAPFSTFGNHVSFVAPGSYVMSTYPKDNYSISSGTSQASPFVAGGVALLKSYAYAMGRKLTDEQIKYLLKHTSDRLGRNLKDLKSGYGLINLLDALKLLKYKIAV